MTTFTKLTEATTVSVAVHNSVFHADDTVAVALTRLFINDSVKVTRLPHQTADFAEFDLVLDIGKKFDGEKHFDHHQYRGGKCAAELLGDALDIPANYPKIAAILKTISAHDVGERTAATDSVITLLGYMNADNIYGDAQDAAFDKAVEVCINWLRPMIQEQDKLKEIEDYYFKLPQATVMVLPEYDYLWSYAINGDNFPEAEAVVWFDKVQKKYKVQTVPNSYGSFTANGHKLLPSTEMEFVHPGGFLGVTPSKEVMNNYLKEIFGVTNTL